MTTADLSIQWGGRPDGSGCIPGGVFLPRLLADYPARSGAADTGDFWKTNRHAAGGIIDRLL